MISEKLLEYLPDPETFKGGIADIVELLEREAPIVVEQLLTWNFVVSLIWFTIWCILTIFGFLCTCGMVTKGIREDGFNDDEGNILATAVVIWLVGTLCACSSLTWLQIAIAPKLYLLEYITDLI